MKTVKIVVLIAVWMMMLPAYADDKSQAPPAGYSGPIAERPVFQPGDYWEYQRDDGKRVKWVFLRQEGDLLVFESGSKKSLLYMTPDLGVIKKVDAKSGKVISQTSPPEASERYRFPLWVGKKWRLSYYVISRNFVTPVTIDVEYRVVSYRPITVLAGTFEAFEVQRIWKARGCDNSGYQTFWYSPEIKNTIKFEDNYPRQLLKARVSSSSK